MSYSRSSLVSILKDYFRDKQNEKRTFIAETHAKIQSNDISRIFDGLPNLPLINKLNARVFSDEFEKIIIRNKTEELSEKTKNRIDDWVKSIIIHGCDDFLDDEGKLHPQLVGFMQWKNLEIDISRIMLAFFSNVYAGVVKADRLSQFPGFGFANHYVNQICGPLTKEVFEYRGFSDVDKFLYDYETPITIVSTGIAGISLLAAVGAGLFAAMNSASEPNANEDANSRIRTRARPNTSPTY